MSGPSINHFSWAKEPYAIIRDDLIIPNRDHTKGQYVKIYYPMEEINNILNAVKDIKNPADALRFVREWGFLGPAKPISNLKSFESRQLKSIVDYIYSERYPERIAPKFYCLDGLTDAEISDYEMVVDEVILNHNKKSDSTGIYFSKSSREITVMPNKKVRKGFIFAKRTGERVVRILNTAKYIEDLSHLKYLMSLYIEDPYIADYEVMEWIKTLPTPLMRYGSSFDEIMKNIETEHLKLRKNKRHTHKEQTVFEFIVKDLLDYVRTGFNFSSNIQVKINKHGDIIIEFEELAYFIIYTIIFDAVPVPRICHDPKCGQLFFPSREGQKYCPPLPQEKRSKCEQRHGQQLRREAKKKAH